MEIPPPCTRRVGGPSRAYPCKREEHLKTISVQTRRTAVLACSLDRCNIMIAQTRAMHMYRTLLPAPTKTISDATTVPSLMTQPDPQGNRMDRDGMTRLLLAVEPVNTPFPSSFTRAFLDTSRSPTYR